MLACWAPRQISEPLTVGRWPVHLYFWLSVCVCVCAHAHCVGFMALPLSDVLKCVGSVPMWVIARVHTSVLILCGNIRACLWPYTGECSTALVTRWLMIGVFCSIQRPTMKL